MASQTRRPWQRRAEAQRLHNRGGAQCIAPLRGSCRIHSLSTYRRRDGLAVRLPPVV